MDYNNDDNYVVMDNLKQPLKSLGFTEKEAQIYMALLELESASYTQLARASGIKRTSLYPIVQNMQERGFVHYEVDRRQLSPTPPDELFQQLQANALQFHRLVPRLKELGKQKRGIARVQFYSGKEGIKRVYLDNSKEKLPPTSERVVRVISDGKTWENFWNEVDPDFTEAYLKDMKARHYQWKVLTSSGTDGIYSKEKGKQYDFEAKTLPENYKSEFDMEIHGSHIIIADLKDKKPYAIRITSTELARALGNFFEFAWNLYGKG